MEETLWGAGFLLLFFGVLLLLGNHLPSWVSAFLSEFESKRRR